MRDLHLHIGLHKTGTSYIQKLFLENRDLLAAEGLGLGPRQHPETGSHHAVVMALRDGEAARVFAETAACPGERILISAEEISSEILDRTTAEAWRDAARAHFNVRVVIFLRRQDHLKESVFAEIVKAWYAGSIQEDTHYDYDHDARMTFLEAVFGRENLTVLVYRDPGPNDIAGDLLRAMGMTLDPARLARVPAQNVAMHRRKTLFLAGLPKHPRAIADPQTRFLARFVSNVVAGSQAVADDGIRFFLSPEERRALVAAHQAGNRAVVARYGIADAGAFTDLPAPDPAWAPPAPITRPEILGVWRDAIRAAALRRPLSCISMSARVSRLFAQMLSRARGAPRD